ncbi:Serine/threonine-protein kinase [Glugoides intestinalis]
MVKEETNAEFSISNSTGYIAEDEYVEQVSIGNYIIIKELGSGSTAKVVLAFDKKTERRVAIKIVKRKESASVYKKESSISSESKENVDKVNDGFNDERIYREIVISTLLDHPHIIKLLDFLYSDSLFFLIFEYVKGDQLYDLILKEGKINEESARKYFRQILSAIDYVHRNSIVHRDLKIENILIDHNDNVKLLDFGLSNFYDNKMFLKTFCGSLYFAAPELLLGCTYTGPEIDVWSLGVILYVMLCGKVPFDDESVKELQTKIKIAQFEFKTSISKKARDLVLQMIVPDASKRAKLNEIIKSKWVNVGYPGYIENYVGKRFPLIKLNEEYIKALEYAFSFQFPNAKDLIKSFFSSCKNQTESLDKLYWTQNPIVSMYYLLSENIASYSNKNSRNLKFDSNVPSYDERLHRFVRFVFSNDSESINRPSKFFFQSVLQESNSDLNSVSVKLPANLPIVHKSYIKGIFQGIRVKHIGSQNALKKILMDVFKKNNVGFEADEKGYFCSFYSNDEECYFKVTLYYNIITSEYYLVLKCLNSKKSSFKYISTTIEKSLKYR